MHYYLSSTTAAADASKFTGIYISYQNGNLGLTTASNDKHFGTPVRCVRDEAPKASIAPGVVAVETVTGSEAQFKVMAPADMSWTVTASEAWMKISQTTGGSGGSSSLNGTGSATLYVYNSNGATSKSDTDQEGTVTLASGGSMRVMLVPPFAKSNVILQGGNLTFNDGSAARSNISEQVQGLFFKWGSLIGVSAADGGFDPVVSIVYRPSEYTTTIYNWAGIPTNNTLVNTSLPTTFNAAAATGDVCHYISSKGWVDGWWRLPTQAEYERLYTVGSAMVGTFSVISGTASSGTTTISSGYNMGISNYLRYFPATGYRYWENGPMSNIGQFGSLWSANAYTNVNDAYYHYFNAVTVNPAQPGGRDNALSVRCVKDTSPRLSVSPASHTFSSAAGESFTFTVTAANLTGDWTFQPNQYVDWFNVVRNGNTITVTTASANTTAANRGLQFVISAPGVSSVVFEVTQKAPSTFAYSNIYYNSNNGRLTFATSYDETLQTYQGLMFKWGSLIGISPSRLATSPYVVFTPSEYTGSTITNYGNIPYTNDLSVTGLPSYNAAAGTGDICRYISDKGWVSGRWRMPTTQEVRTLYNANPVLADRIEQVGPFSASSNGETNIDGTTAQDSGGYIGMDDARRFFPITGYRMGGNPSGPGHIAGYWTSSPTINSYTNMLVAYELFFDGDDEEYVNYYQDTSYAFAIRCITE
jgi:uncharacterized protein (TIGR02145 family)